MLKRETILAGLVFLLFAVAAYSQFATTTIKEDGFTEYLTGEMAKIRVHGAPGPLSDHLITREDGSQVTMKEMAGKVMLINLWASWCAPCRSEMPELSRLQKALGDDRFEVVAISVDRGGIAMARDVLEEWGIDGLPLYAEPTARIAFDLADGALPKSFIVDKNGMVIGSYLGPLKWDAPEALALFTALKNQ